MSANLDDALSRVNAYLDAYAKVLPGRLDAQVIDTFNGHPLFVGDLRMLIAHAGTVAAAARHPGG